MPFLLLRRRFMPLHFFSFPNPTKPYPLRRFPNPNPSLTTSSSSSLAMSATNISGGVYVPPMRRLRSVVEVPSPSNGARSPLCSPSAPPSTSSPAVSNGAWRDSSWQQTAGYSTCAYDDWSDDDSDRERDRSPASSKVYLSPPPPPSFTVLTLAASNL